MKKLELYNKIIEDKETAAYFAYLCERWEAEQGYEDIEDYLKAIKKHIPQAEKIYIDPFGIDCKCSDGYINIFFEVYEDYLSLEYREIK